MLYMLYGTEEFLIKKELKKIISNNEYIEYDLNEINIGIIIEDADMIPFLSDKKIIIANNAFLFTGSIKKDIEHKIDVLEKYLNNPNSDTILIFIVNNEKLDERKKIVKLLKQNGIVKEFNKINDYNLITIIKDLFDDYQIDNNTIKFLIDYAGKNLNILEQEINKLKIYKYDEKVITINDIKNIVSKSMDDTLFDLIEMIINNNKEKALSVYYEMLKRNEEPIKIIVMLANQFRIIYQAKELYKEGYTEKDIAITLCIHPYRIKLALEKASKYDSKNLLSYLNKLADLDYEIKSGKTDKNIALELFILGI